MVKVLVTTAVVWGHHGESGWLGFMTGLRPIPSKILINCECDAIVDENDAGHEGCQPRHSEEVKIYLIMSCFLPPRLPPPSRFLLLLLAWIPRSSTSNATELLIWLGSSWNREGESL